MSQAIKQWADVLRGRKPFSADDEQQMLVEIKTAPAGWLQIESIPLESQLSEALATIDWQCREINRLRTELLAASSENSRLRRGLKDFGPGYVALHDAMKRKAP